MLPFAERLISEHIDDLLRDAEAGRRATIVARSNRVRAAWRRSSGAAARRLSEALEDLALRLDPAACQPSYGRE